MCPISQDTAALLARQRLSTRPQTALAKPMSAIAKRKRKYLATASSPKAQLKIPRPPVTKPEPYSTHVMCKHRGTYKAPRRPKTGSKKNKLQNENDEVKSQGSDILYEKFNSLLNIDEAARLKMQVDDLNKPRLRNYQVIAYQKDCVDNYEYQ